MIKWLISQQVRAVNTSSKTTKETEEEGKRGRKAKEMNHKRKKSEIENACEESFGEEVMCTDWSAWHVRQNN